jgi:hypothetical protein
MNGEAKKTYPCAFDCGAVLPTKSARRTHNKSCLKNVHRGEAQLINKRMNHKKKHFKSNPKGMDADLFSEIFDDLPDGAFFAMAEENGLFPEDFID